MKQKLGQLSEQLGWQGMSGITLLIFAGLFHFFVLHSLEQETEFLRNRWAIAHAKESNKSQIYGVGNQQKGAEDFSASLPTETDVTDILASISAIAEVGGVELKQAEYRLGGKNARHSEYEMIFPVQGGYANIRYFVFRVLSEHPAVALDSVNFARERAGDSVLNAEIRLTLFLRREE